MFRLQPASSTNPTRKCQWKSEAIIQAKLVGYLKLQSNSSKGFIFVIFLFSFHSGCEEIENLSNMSRRGSWITLRSVVDVVRASRFQSSYGGLQRNSPFVSAARVESSYWISPGLHFFSTNSKTSTNANGYNSTHNLYFVPIFNQFQSEC